MSDTEIVLLFSGLLAVIFGPLTARSSARRDPIYGGLLARILHLLAAMAFVPAVPAVLIALIVGAGIGVALPLAFGLLFSSLFFLLLFSALERRPRQIARSRADQRGWTEEDARTSGL